MLETAGSNQVELGLLLAACLLAGRGAGGQQRRFGWGASGLRQERGEEVPGGRGGNTDSSLTRYQVSKKRGWGKEERE